VTFYSIILYIIILIASLIFLDGINTSLSISAGIIIILLSLLLYQYSNNSFLRLIGILVIISWTFFVFYGLITSSQSI
jgi:hypothetical protein